MADRRSPLGRLPAASQEDSVDLTNILVFLTYLFVSVFILLSTFLALLAEAQGQVREDEAVAKALAKAGDETGQIQIDYAPTHGEMLIELLKKVDKLSADLAAQQQAAAPPAAPPAAPRSNPGSNGGIVRKRRSSSSKARNVNGEDSQPNATQKWLENETQPASYGEKV